MKGKAKAWPQGRRYRPASAELSCKLWAPSVRREALESPREAASLRQHLTFLLESWAGNRCGARVIKHWGCFGVYYYSRLNPRKQFSFLPSPLTLKILLFLRDAILELWALQFLLFSLSPFTEREIAADARRISGFSSSGRTSRVDHIQ